MIYCIDIIQVLYRYERFKVCEFILNNPDKNWNWEYISLNTMTKIQTFKIFVNKIIYLNYENSSIENLKDSIHFSILAESEKEFLYKKIDEYKYKSLFGSVYN